MFECVGNADWPISSVYDLATWRNGLAFKNIDFADIGRPVIKIAELKNGVTQQTARTAAQYDPSIFVGAGDMLFSWSGNPDTSIDVFRWRGEEGWLNQHIFKVKPRTGVLEEFLFFLLRWLRPRFAEIARNKQTTGLGHVTIQDLRRMMVGVPDVKEQSAIISIVGPLQEKIDLNHRMRETAEAMARAIFKNWLQSNEPTFVRSRVSELAAKGILKVGDGYRAKNDELGSPGLPFIRAGELNNGFDTYGADVLNEKSLPSAGDKLSRTGDDWTVRASVQTNSEFCLLTPSVFLAINQYAAASSLCPLRLDGQRRSQGSDRCGIRQN
jgi:hypothetical protein